MANKNFSTLDEDAISFENSSPLNLAPGPVQVDNLCRCSYSLRGILKSLT